ncbi:MAG: xanthine dehydrogenase family protein molybdopterin-binding subunit [Acidobacteriota bacterium]|nr:xanthine dehydrogenase family protein molybdopterin-binding subunit [Acidobacteriota bacterium]
MDKCKYDWPAEGDRSLIGKRIKRIDGPAKASGGAKYTYDINRPGLLIGKIYRSPYAHAKITAIDTSEAEKLPGVKTVKVIMGVGKETNWVGDEIIALAAVSEDIAEDALRKIKVEFEELPHLVLEENLEQAGSHGTSAGGKTVGDPAKAFSDPEVVISEGYYGIAAITHCCLESHGNVAEWTGEKLLTYSSTQNVPGLPSQIGQSLREQGMTVPDKNIETICNYVGGGFGSKFGPDEWGIHVAQLAKAAGKPVKLMLDRNMELEGAGARPSSFAQIKVAAKKDGTLVAWDSHSWGTGGPSGTGMPPLPYVLQIPNSSTKHTSISTNTGPARAWRAPDHPQAAALTMCALEDLAAKLNMDPIEFFSKNADLAAGGRGKVYREELQKAAELADWKNNWHPRGDKTAGHMKRGMGLSMHTWGGAGHKSMCTVSIHPDGSVEVTMGSQDLGTGTRTVIAIVAAETLGLPVEAVTVNIGDSKYPPDDASGGSTTVGGVSASTRRGSIDALDQLFAVIAPALGVPADHLVAVGGNIQAKGDASKKLSWKDACAKLHVKSIQATGKHPDRTKCKLGDSGVGGVQIADVSVDTETGLVRINKMVAVQDCGLIIDLKTAESQCYGALIMGITYALFEEKIMDQITGRMLNNNMEFYKLAGIGDIGELVVHMMTGLGYDERGVIGLGEPPVISPGAAISNAVANAIGVRVPTIPLTPDKVLAALAKGGVA